MIELLIASALAWEHNDADWSAVAAPVDEPFLFNATSFEDLGVDADSAEAAYERALDVWNSESGADVYLEYGGRSTSTVRGGGDNDENVAFYGDFTPSAGIAITTWGYADTTVNDCDTEFHSSNIYGTIDWYVATDDEATPEYEFDIVHTMIHETGHCLGLGHSADDDAIMRTYNSSGTGDESRHLHPDDIAGMQAIYGAVSPELDVHEPILGDDPVEGTTIRIDLPIENLGDGSAWHVVAVVDDGPPFDVGNIGSDTPVGTRVGPDTKALSFPWAVTCDGGFDVVLTDAVGTEWSERVVIDCVPADDTAGETPGGCACSSSPTSAGWPVSVVFGLFAWAQQRRRGAFSSVGGAPSPA